MAALQRSHRRAAVPADEPYDTATLTGLLGPRGHRVFPGRLEPSRLSAPERAVVTAMRAPVGDFRDWDAVRTWAAEIAMALAAVLPTPEAPH